MLPDYHQPVSPAKAHGGTIPPRLDLPSALTMTGLGPHCSYCLYHAVSETFTASLKCMGLHSLLDIPSTAIQRTYTKHGFVRGP